MSDKEQCKRLTNRQIVTQSNQMINARYSLDITEQRLILLAISQVNSVKDTQFFEFETSIKELEERLKTKLNETRLQNLAIGILKKPFAIKDEKGWVALNWFSSIRYYKGEAKLRFKMDNTLIPYLLELKSNFTKFELGQALKFDGKYSVRFYGFLTQVRNMKEKRRKFELNFLYEILELPKSLRVFADFKRKVLQPSLNEINSKSDIKATYKLIRTGRKYTHIELSWVYQKEMTEKTEKARNKKEFLKYVGKIFKDEVGQIQTILSVRYTTQRETGLVKKICASYAVGANTYRSDFADIESLELAIKQAENEKYIKENLKKEKEKEIVNMIEKGIKKIKK